MKKNLKIIISPAKKMNTDLETLEPLSFPVYLKHTEMIMKKMQELSIQEAQKLWKCNDVLAAQNYARFQEMNLYENRTPAILSYEGIQYKYMSPTVFESSMLDYVQEHLKILSGFYGVLKPMDGVTPYRLEMQAKLSIKGFTNLYGYWGDSLYKEVTENKENTVIVNLASKEYSIAIEKYLDTSVQYITCIFGELQDGKVIQKGTYAKMARGEMVRFMAENYVEDVEEIKKFNRLGYEYQVDLSRNDCYVFISKKDSKN